jgi:hypothetical protein
MVHGCVPWIVALGFTYRYVAAGVRRNVHGGVDFYFALRKIYGKVSAWKLNGGRSLVGWVFSGKINRKVS